MSQPTKARSLQILGWLLFIACALCYIAANIRSGDWLSLWGSLLFLLACLVFMAQLLPKPVKQHESADKSEGAAN